jgi:hypothetical protein
LKKPSSKKGALEELIEAWLASFFSPGDWS